MKNDQKNICFPTNHHNMQLKQRQNQKKLHANNLTLGAKPMKVCLCQPILYSVAPIIQDVPVQLYKMSNSIPFIHRHHPQRVSAKHTGVIIMQKVLACGRPQATLPLSSFLGCPSRTTPIYDVGLCHVI